MAQSEFVDLIFAFEFIFNCSQSGSEIPPALTKLVKSLQDASPTLDMDQCISSCCQGYFNGSKVSYSEIKGFLFTLNRAVSDIFISVCILNFFSDYQFRGSSLIVPGHISLLSHH